MRWIGPPKPDLHLRPDIPEIHRQLHQLASRACATAAIVVCRNDFVARDGSGHRRAIHWSRKSRTHDEIESLVAWVDVFGLLLVGERERLGPNGDFGRRGARYAVVALLVG